MATIKITKAQYFKAIIEAIKEQNFVIPVDDIEVTEEDIVDFAKKEIEQLGKRAEAAKTRAAKKKAEGDPLKATIEEILTNDYQTIADIIAQIDDEEVTPQKVSARLSALVKEGKANKTEVKFNKGTRMAYAAGPAPTPAE